MTHQAFPRHRVRAVLLAPFPLARMPSAGRPRPRGRQLLGVAVAAALALVAAGGTAGGNPTRCAPGVLVYDGDSLTAHLPAPPRVMVAFDDARLALGPSLAYHISAVRGQTAAQMAARAPTVVDPFYRPHASVNVLVAWAGTNDLYDHSPKGGPAAAAADALHALRAYGAARRRVGWFVVVLTTLPRQDHDVRPDFEQARALLNGDVRGAWPTFANALVDIAGDARVGPVDAPQRLRYYLPDHVHLTSAGQRIVADLELPILERMACAAPGPLPRLDHMAPVALRSAPAGASVR